MNTSTYAGDGAAPAAVRAVAATTGTAGERVFRDLTPLFRPRGIAVVGASPRGNRGLKVLTNLRRFGYPGAVHAVNPGYEEVGGYPCVADVADLPAGTDLVVVAVSSQGALPVVDAAGRAGIRAAVVVASGFGDGGHGTERGQELRALLDEHGMVAVGPNCYGVLDVRAGVAAYAGSVVDPLEPGRVALLLQSGALSHAVTDSALGRGLGLSAVVTTGNELSASLADHLAWFADDEHTDVIGIFLEGLRDTDSFVAAARRARAAGTPVVVLATGRSERGRAAALAHTGAVSGSGGALSGLLRSVGAIQVEDLDEFRETLLLLSALGARRRAASGTAHPTAGAAGGDGPPGGGGAAIVSVSGAGTGLMADTADRVGLDLPVPTERTAAAIREALPQFAVAANPLDATGAAAEDPTLLSTVMGRLGEDPAVDVVGFAFNVGQGGAGQEGFYREQARRLAAFAATSSVPVVGLSMTSGPVDPVVHEELAAAGVPMLAGMRPALGALAAWLRWQGPLPEPAAEVPRRPVPGDGAVVGTLDAFGALEDVGVPVPAYELVSDPGDAAAAAARVGLPCVVKIESPDVLHKTELGGVRVGLTTTEEVAAAAREVWASVRSAAPGARLDGLLVQHMVDGPALECLLGVVRDPQAGLVLSVAPGGVLVELLGEAASLPVPLTAQQAGTLVDAGPLARLLPGYRGRPAFDRDALVAAVVAFSELTAAYGPALAAAEVNPLLVLPQGRGVAAVDCLIVREDPAPAATAGPKEDA